MSVSFYPCSSCGDTYCDCGDYVTCNEEAGGCGRDWCSDDCAYDDGYISAYCKLDKEVEYGCCEEECELSENGDCTECKSYVKASCNYCRHEDYEDSDLLEYCLKALDITREELIKLINEEKEILLLNKED